MTFDSLSTELLKLSVIGVVAGVAAYFSAYLNEAGKIRAIKEQLDTVARQQADIVESAKARWSRRSEVIAGVYGKLILTIRAFRNYLSPTTQSTDDAVARLREVAREFDDYSAAMVIFLPRELEKKLEWMAEELLQVFMFTTRMRPAEGDARSPDATEHWKSKREGLARVKDDGDIAHAVCELKSELRKLLDIGDA